MADLQILTNHNASDDRVEFQNFEFQNFINKLEQLAFGVDPSLSNISIDHKDLEVTLGNGDLLDDAIASSRAGPPHITHAHGIEEMEYSRVVSDIWIGVILTLLIVSVIFFICACFLYHKFQQWKNSYRTNNNNESSEICRNYPLNYEVESLPSYTIVSGLPTYDDAIEEFRKAGIMLTPTIPVIKIFETKESKDSYNVENGITEADNVSMASVNSCTYGGNGVSISPSGSLNSANGTSQQYLAMQPNPAAAALNTQFIELTPKQLNQLSQKRLSLQIGFSPAIHRPSRPRVDMRNNLLRSRIVSNNAEYDTNFPRIHRSSSSFSLAHECNMQQMQHHLQHRGSLF